MNVAETLCCDIGPTDPIYCGSVTRLSRLRLNYRIAYIYAMQAANRAIDEPQKLIKYHVISQVACDLRPSLIRDANSTPMPGIPANQTRRL